MEKKTKMIPPLRKYDAFYYAGKGVTDELKAAMNKFIDEHKDWEFVIDLDFRKQFHVEENTQVSAEV